MNSEQVCGMLFPPGGRWTCVTQACDLVKCVRERGHAGAHAQRIELPAARPVTQRTISQALSAVALQDFLDAMQRGFKEEVERATWRCASLNP